MTTATFDTILGRIEVKRHNSDGSWKGSAYFFGQDFETEVNGDGEFHDINLREFRVYWPMAKDGDAILEAIMPRTIGRTNVARN